MNFFKTFILARLKEPSTYAGVGMLGAAFGIGPELVGPISQVVMAVGGLLAVVLRDKGAPAA